MPAEVRQADVGVQRSWAPRRTILLTRACNNACVFCGQPTSADTFGYEVHLESLRALRSETDGVTFTGGEPLAYDRLVELVAAARSLGFRGVGLQTNARLFARSELAAELASAGLTDIHVSIHGSDVAVHDYHTGVAGSFAETTVGVAKARAAGLVVVATTVLTRSNYRSIGHVPRFLASRTVAAWQVAVPHARGRAFERFDRVFPRLGLVIPFALHATSAAERLGLRARIGGAPLCLFGPFVERAMPIGADAVRTHGATCERCPARASCPGIDAHYLERFAEDELSVVQGMPKTDVDPIFRLFTGLGERAPLPETRDPAHEAPRAARRKLPVLTRAQPGAQETRRSAPKTGDDLREILPALFEGKSEP